MPPILTISLAFIIKMCCLAYDPNCHLHLSQPLHFKKKKPLTVCASTSPSTGVQLSACPACLCTEPECRRPPAGPSGSPGARRTTWAPSPGLSARPASTAPLWVCLVPHSAAAAQNRQWPADARQSARPPPGSLWEPWWGHPRLDPRGLRRK